MTIISAYAAPHPPIILPEVGKGQEKEIQATIDGFREAARRFNEDQADTVVIISPHAAMYSDYFSISPGTGAGGDMSRFGAKGPRTVVEYDSEFARSLGAAASGKGIAAGFAGERDSTLDHGCVVPLRFFQETWDRFRAVRIGISGFPTAAHYELGRLIARVSAELNRRTVIIASGDLSHRLKSDGPYGYAPEGPEFDRQVMACLGAGDFLALTRVPEKLREAAGECGWRAFVMMAGAFDGREVEAEKLSYEGPFGVGYGVCAFKGGNFDESRSFGGLI